MRRVLIQITCPDEVDVESMVSSMVDDFYYSNRETEEFGPHMDDIRVSYIEDGIETPIVV
jgi:hypothetical protein